MGILVDAMSVDNVEILRQGFAAWNAVDAHGAGHGPDADLELTGVYTARNGVVVFTEFFWGRAEALKTLRLDA